MVSEFVGEAPDRVGGCVECLRGIVVVVVCVAVDVAGCDVVVALGDGLRG